MDMKFKTLDKQRFSMFVDPHDQVEDLIFGLENLIGRENLYRLIYAGKLLKEGTPVSNYNISPKLPVIIMITQPIQQNVDNVLIEEIEMTRSKAFPETKGDMWLRTESEDAGYDSEEDMPTNFVTETEFSVALDVVMKCENLFDQHKTPLTQEEMIAYINTKLDDLESNFKDVILGEIDLVLKRRPNKKQISAFLVDIQGIFNETRDIRNSMAGKIVDIDFGNEQSGEITKMQESHFGKEETEKIKSSNNNKWVNQIPSKLSAFQEDSLYFPRAYKNLLSFLHGNEKFQFLSLVLQDPSQFQPLLLSFGQSHTNLMNLVFGNKKNFVKMLLDEKQNCEN